MDAYRFIVFPSGFPPTTDELRQFIGYRDLLHRHIAYGKRRHDAALAICCEAEPFEELRALDPKFEDLLRKWRVRGAEVTDSLPFSKAPELWSRLKPRETPPTKPRPPAPTPEPTRAAEKPERDAAVAEGHLRVTVHDAAEQGRRYERLGRWLPYALAALAGVALLAIGAYVGERLAASTGERRTDTIRRVADDALTEPLARPMVRSDEDP